MAEETAPARVRSDDDVVERLPLWEQCMVLAHSGRPYGGWRVGSTHRETDVIDRLVAAGYEIVRVGEGHGRSSSS